MAIDVGSIRQQIAAGGSREFVSPSFLILPPEITHEERMPDEIRAMLRLTWDKIWFPPRPFQLDIFENVFVASEGLALRGDGQVIEQTITQHTPEEIRLAQEAVKAVSSFRSCPSLAGNALLCRKRGCGIYGHWLVEILPWIYLASRWPEPVRFFVQELTGRMAAMMRETLAPLGIGDGVAVRAGLDPVWVERLIVVHGLTEHGSYMSPVSVDCLQAVTDAFAPSGADAVFVTRSTERSRRLVDEERILDEARRAGFAILDPGTMSFAEQVASFKAARRIVGVMGSALANIAFASPGAEVFVLAPDIMPDNFFWFLGGHRKLTMTEVRCETAPPRTGNAPFDLSVRIDTSDLARVLDLTERRRPRPLWFDPDFYLARYPDVAAAGIDPLLHYCEHGWRESRTPSEAFDGARYLEFYDDVRTSGLNPLVHFLRHGRREGRRTFGSAVAGATS